MGGAFSSIFGFAKNSIQKTLNLGWYVYIKWALLDK
jgi:hypothetical protein